VNVLFLTYSYLPNVGGVERSVRNLAELLIERGHHVVVATHGMRAFPFRYRARDVPPTLRLHIPSQTDEAASARAFRSVMNPLNLATLACFCRLRRIDVVHGHLLNTDTVYARQLARLLNVRFILTLRGGETEEWIHTSTRRRYVVEQLRGADYVTAVSASLLIHAATFVPEITQRSTVIPNPIDPERVRETMSRAPEEPERDRLYVLFAGRLEFMKDVECLIDAYHLAVANHSEFTPDLLIVGDGTRAADLHQRALGGPGAGRIRFLGSLPYARTLRLIAGAMMIVLPSRCSEGCPNVVLEAMALGAPVIVSDIPSLTELVEDGVSGRVFAVGDSRRLKERLRELAADPEVRAALVAAARARVTTRHAGAAVADRYCDLYARSLGVR
jgi:glycogen(starch) synthase